MTKNVSANAGEMVFPHPLFVRPGEYTPVRIARGTPSPMAVAGTLVYEAHGKIKDAQDVCNAIFVAGKGYGMRKPGASTC